MEVTTNSANTAWGPQPISVARAEAFAARLPYTALERGNIARTLHDFQPDGMVRGMFFTSLRGALADVMATSLRAA